MISQVAGVEEIQKQTTNGQQLVNQTDDVLIHAYVITSISSN